MLGWIGDNVKVILSKEDFEASLKEAGERLVAVDFSATWCGPCRTIKPFFHALSMKHEDVVFLEVDPPCLVNLKIYVFL
uniref:Thioredoxin domain-containing protein n=1 Tax=Theropithecus gelada TaxID=9565 RepID=A0A8D2EXT0_THEGE